MKPNLYTIKNTQMKLMIYNLFIKKTDQLNQNVDDLEASIKLLELKNQSASDATLNSDEQTIDSTV